MSVSSQQLYDLLPAIHRLRDAENNEVLKSYLTVFAESTSSAVSFVDVCDDL